MKDKYKTLIKACWIVLLCCFVVKLLGGNFYEIACYNETFIKICDFFKVNSTQYYLLMLSISFPTYLFFISAMLQRKINYSKTYIMIIFISVLIQFIFKAINTKILFLNFILEYVVALLIPLIIDKNKWKTIILGNILNVVFQVISLITKNIGLHIIDDNVLITLIFMIDYYIMIILYYLYSLKLKKGE